MIYFGTELAMKHRCPCGLKYLVTPKEIPLNENERIVCICGRDVKGRWSSKFFDYELIQPAHIVSLRND